MATKKERKSAETKNRKFKKGKRIAILSVIGVAFFGFLAFFFVSIFNMVYPPVSGKNGAQARKEKQPVILYFSDKNELFLVPEKRFIVKEKSPEALAKGLVEALVEGSKEGLVNTFPEKVSVKNVKIGSDRIAYVNFSRDFIKDHPGGTTAEISTIYSLTNTLARNIPSVQSVKILVENKPVGSIKGHVSTDGAFRLDKERIVEGSRNI
ncbi:MAG: GerMN domain-containing protein [Syntrophaceae bacterium]|nr:GerMN domain-containing protein [Syntrophaceae bacterium]